MLLIEVILARLEDLIKLCVRADDLSVPGQCAVYAAVMECGRQVRQIIDDQAEGDPLAHEKISLVERHVNAAIGFDVDSGHSVRQHAACAIAELLSLRAALEPIIKGRR